MNEYLATSADKKWFKVQLESLISKEAHSWDDIAQAKAALVTTHLPGLVRQRFTNRPGTFSRDRSAEFNSYGRFQRRQLKAAWGQWEQIETEIKRSLMDAAIDVLDDSLENFKKVSKSSKPADLRASVADKWQPLVRRPVLPPREMTPTDAEHFVCEYMLFLGASGAKVTQQSRDGGIDVVSDDFIVQVKHQHSPVGVKVVREMLGLSVSSKKAPVVFAKHGFSEDAFNFAIEHGVALFAYMPIFAGIPGLGERYSMQGMEKVIPLSESPKWSPDARGFTSAAKIKAAQDQWRLGK